MSHTTEWVPKGREYKEKGRSLSDPPLAFVEHAGIGLDELIEMIDVQLSNAGTWSVRDVASGC